jgi:hypothetical protein
MLLSKKVNGASIRPMNTTAHRKKSHCADVGNKRSGKSLIINRHVGVSPSECSESKLASQGATYFPHGASIGITAAYELTLSLLANPFSHSLPRLQQELP